MTPNTGSSDYVTEGVNGSVVPIRDAAAIAEKAIWWWRRISSGENIKSSRMTKKILSPKQVRELFLERITALIPKESGF